MAGSSCTRRIYRFSRLGTTTRCSCSNVRESFRQYRIVRADDGEVRWIEARNLIFYDQSGKPTQLIGVSIDFTERKVAEEMLAERNLQLEIAGKVELVGSYAYNGQTEKMQISQGYAAIYGFPDRTTEITYGEWLAYVHPQGYRI